jgi:DNA mismatch endonuclease (patch repair protein)
VHGCFWHQHQDSVCTRSAVPKSNENYWLPKLQRTVGRDKVHMERLKELGWNVEIIWECQINKERLENLLYMIRNGSQ